jgi:hypothetical protein
MSASQAHANAFFTHSIARCLRFFTFTQSLSAAPIRAVSTFRDQALSHVAGCAEKVGADLALRPPTRAQMRRQIANAMRRTARAAELEKQRQADSGCSPATEREGPRVDADVP